MISGTGNTKTYSLGEGLLSDWYESSTCPPWLLDYRDQITSVIFEEGVAPTSLAYWFFNCSNLTSVSNLPDSVTDMSNTFYYCLSLEKAPEIPENVTDMSYTFGWCESLVEAPAIPEGVTSMRGTFLNCISLVKAPEIPEGVTDMGWTFFCTSLVEAPEIPYGVTNMCSTFEGCESLVEAPLIPSTVTDMSWTFSTCPSLTSLPDGFSFPEGADITGVFGWFFVGPSYEYIVTYCSADDYEALLAAYDWEGSYRILVARGDYEGSIISYSGSDRYETAKLIVDQELALAEELGITFKGIIVANGGNSYFPDALAASSLSGLLDYPIVLTSGSSLSEEAKEAIEVVYAAADGDLDIIVIGGTNAISQAVRSELAAYGTVNNSVQGADRYATAQAIYDYGATRNGGWNTEYTIIATGASFPDALSVASYAAYANVRVVLVNGTLNSLPESTKTEIAGSENIVIIGGTNTVSQGIENELISTFGSDHVTRLGGSDRYETSVLVAEWALTQGMSLDGVGFATGTSPADALASSTLLGMTGSVLLLMSSDSSENTAALELLADAEGVNSINIFGGINSVSIATRASIFSALG